MMGGAVEVEAGKWAKRGSSFGNFVFLGLRSNSGIRHEGALDLYLHRRGRSLALTDYGVNFVAKNTTLCSAH
jgi:hypothetical protein